MAKMQMSLRVDPALVREVQKALRAPTKTEAIERSLKATLEMARHRRIIRRYSGTGQPDDFQGS